MKYFNDLKGLVMAYYFGPEIESKKWEIESNLHTQTKHASSLCHALYQIFFFFEKISKQKCRSWVNPTKDVFSKIVLNSSSASYLKFYHIGTLHYIEVTHSYRIKAWVSLFKIYSIGLPPACLLVWVAFI